MGPWFMMTAPTYFDPPVKTLLLQPNLQVQSPVSLQELLPVGHLES
jgi:hypothetical protein